MIFTLSYEIDYERVMSAVINDSRSTIPAISGQSGNVIYGYIQAQIAQVTPNVLVYRILSNGSVLAGFCAIQVGAKSAILLLSQLRPAFVPFESEILDIIATFMIENRQSQDILY